jgi:tripartite-type tricarboxylate transporter receptor subunit TctC
LPPASARLQRPLSRADAKYPDRTIRLVVPFPAGGATDVVGRMFADN